MFDPTMAPSGGIGPMTPEQFFKGPAHVRTDKGYANELSYYSWLYNIIDLYVSVFEWKNLPEGCDSRMFEWWLMWNGYCGFVYDDIIAKAQPRQAPYGYAVMRLMLTGQMDMYNLPEDVTAYSVDNDATNVRLDPGNAVIVFNDQARVNPLPKLTLFASRLCNIDRAIDVNIEQQKAPKVIKCTQPQKLSFVNMMNQVAANEVYIWADPKLDLNSVEVLDTTAPYVADKMEYLKHQIWNEFLTFCGIENTNTDKKERMITNEVMSNMGDVEAHRFTRLKPRKKACDEINDLLDRHGWFDDPMREPVDVEFSSGVYIRTDKEGTIPVQGMAADENDMDVTGGYQSDGEPSGFLAKLRRVILGE